MADEQRDPTEETDESGPTEEQPPKSGWERVMEILRLPLKEDRLGHLNHFLSGGLLAGGGLIGLLILAILLYVLLRGDNPDSASSGDSQALSGRDGNNDGVGERLEYEKFDFAVIDTDGRRPLRQWTHDDVEKLQQREVSVPGEGNLNGPSLNTLLSESGAGDWKGVFLTGSSRTTPIDRARDGVNNDWILLFQGGQGQFTLDTYTLVIPDRPRSEWPAGISQFNLQ